MRHASTLLTLSPSACSAPPRAWINQPARHGGGCGATAAGRSGRGPHAHGGHGRHQTTRSQQPLGRKVKACWLALAQSAEECCTCSSWEWGDRGHLMMSRTKSAASWQVEYRLVYWPLVALDSKLRASPSKVPSPQRLQPLCGELLDDFTPTTSVGTCVALVHLDPFRGHRLSNQHGCYVKIMSWQFEQTQKIDPIAVVLQVRRQKMCFPPNS